MNTLIKADLFRLNSYTFTLKNLFSGLRNAGFRYLFFTRLKERYNSLPVNLFLKLLTHHYTMKYGFQIPVKNIGGGLYIGHFGTIVISVNAVLGRNCNIAHNVTIGAARGKRSGAPKIGDFVWIGTGAVLVGNIRIGSHVLIAPNSYVNFDVPDHSLVIGNPGKVVSKYNPTKNYINNPYPFPDLPLIND